MNTRVTSVDCNQSQGIFLTPSEFAKSFAYNRFPDRSRFVEAYFAREGEAPSFAKRIDETWDEKFDLIFIDADHRYEAVKRDFETPKQLLCPGGPA